MRRRILQADGSRVIDEEDVDDDDETGDEEDDDDDPARIVKINGEAASTLKEFVRFFADQEPSQRLVLETVKDGRPSTVEITLWARF